MKFIKFLLSIMICNFLLITQHVLAATTSASPQDNPNATSGLYIGLSGGWGNVRDTNDLDFSVEGNGFAGSAFAGWHFNQYWDLEGGFIHIPDDSIDLEGFDEDGNLVDVNVNLKSYAWYVLGKGSLPFSLFSPSLNKFSLYVKGGAAYVHSELEASAEGVSVNVDNASSWEPLYGTGIAYSFNKNVSIDFGWTGIHGRESNSELQTPMVNIFSLGLSYRFV